MVEKRRTGEYYASSAAPELSTTASTSAPASSASWFVCRGCGMPCFRESQRIELPRCGYLAVRARLRPATVVEMDHRALLTGGAMVFNVRCGRCQSYLGDIYDSSSSSTPSSSSAAPLDATAILAGTTTTTSGGSNLAPAVFRVSSLCVVRWPSPGGAQSTNAALAIVLPPGCSEVEPFAEVADDPDAEARDLAAQQNGMDAALAALDRPDGRGNVYGEDQSSTDEEASSSSDEDEDEEEEGSL
jgi:hypothetical protein